MSGLHYESMADMPPGLRARYAAQKVAARIVAAPDKAAPVAGNHKNKFKNERVTINEIRFDSKKEYFRFLALMDAVKEGVIYDLRLQQNFTLIEGYTETDGERIQPVVYRADFTYKVSWPWHSVPTAVGIDDLKYWRWAAEEKGPGVLIIEDVKSRATRTRVYINKYKMMAERGLKIREV